MKFINILCTDFGEVELPEDPPKLPMIEVRETRYNEFTGKPYKITLRYPDYQSPEGKLWQAYEQHVDYLVEQAWHLGDEVSEVDVPKFSEWVKGL